MAIGFSRASDKPGHHISKAFVPIGQWGVLGTVWLSSNREENALMPSSGFVSKLTS
jgi:hypothetical protein